MTSQSLRLSLAAAVTELTTEEIQERHIKHIAEISKHLATEPMQSEELNYERARMAKFSDDKTFS